MRAGEAKPYFESLQEDLAQTNDPQLSSWYETEISLTADYKEAAQLRDALGQFSNGLAQLIEKAATEESTSIAELPQSDQSEIIIEPQENGHSVESQAIKWASDTLGEYVRLPSARPVKLKKADSRDRNFVRKHLERVHLDDEDKGPLLSNPELLAQSLETWAAVAQEKGGRTAQFFELAVGELGDMAKRNWRDMSKENLAGLMRGWTHAEFVGEAFEYIAKKHFEGPGKLMDQLSAYLDLCLSAQYVLDDQQAIDKIADTLYYRTKAIPRGGHIQHAVANTTYRVDDLQLCRLANDIDKVSSGVSLIASGDRNAYKHDYYAGVAMSNRDAVPQDFAKANNLTLTDATKLLDSRRQALEAFIDAQEAFKPREFKELLIEKFGEEATEWVWQAAYITSPAREEYVRTFGARAMSNVMRGAFKSRNEMYPQHPDAYTIKDVLSIPMVNNMMLDILIPEAWAYNSDELAMLLKEINDWTDDKGLDEAVERLTEEDSGMSMGYSRLLATDMQLGEHKVVCAARHTCDLDKLHEHELNELLWHNLPSLAEELVGASEDIIERIRQSQRRFVSKRGFRVSFRSEEMLQNGFQSIAFKKDAAHPNTLSVALLHNNKPLRFRLNQRLQLDLEGKRLHSERLQKVIEQRTLAILEDYMTRDALESNEGTISGAETGTTSRIAHLAYLPAGQNFSEEAWEHCRREQGIDLQAMNLRRKLLDSESRNSTYRRATEYDDPSADPLEIYVLNPEII